MSQNYIIREATDADYPQILSIYRYYWNKHFENMPDDYEKVLSYLTEAFDKRKGYFNYWVCDNGDGGIYGWLSCLPVFFSPLRKSYNGELSIYLRIDKHNSIVAHKLAHEVVNEILPKSQIMVLWAHIDPANEPSKKLTEYFGFRNVTSTSNSPFYCENEVWVRNYK